MTIEKLIETAKSIGNGKWFSIKHITDTPLNATAKNGGVKIKHICTEQVRSGVNYENLSAVKAIREQGIVGQPKNYDSIVGNKIQRNPKNGEYYIQLVDFKTTDDEYEVTENGKVFTTNLDGIAKYVTPSYFKSHKEGNRNYHIVKAENIVSIKQSKILAN